MTVFYNVGTPGEISHERARAEVQAMLDNPFSRHRMPWRVAYQTPAIIRNAPKPWVPQGAMLAYLKAAAMREATQGES